MIACLMLCRHVYNAAIGERREAWRMRGVTVTYYQQKAELPGIKEAMPEYAEVNAQVLQDVVLRVDRAFQAFFRRVGRADAGLSALPRARPLQQLHLPTGGRAWRRATGQWLPGPVQDRAHRRALVAPNGGHAQDGHDHPRSGRLVCLLLLRGCASAAASCHWTGDRA